MMKRRLIAIPVMLALTFCVLIAFPASADVEPNDSLQSPEVIGEGTYTGSVYTNGSFDSDVDYYKLTLPADMDIEVTLTKTNSEPGTITVNSFDHNLLSNSIFGVWIMVDTQGEVGESSDYNGADVDRAYYLEVSGQGNYTMEIEFTTATADSLETLGNVCMVFVVVIIVIFVLLIGLIIVIVIFRKKKKKNQPQQPGVQVTSSILHSEVVDVAPQQPIQPAAPPPVQQTVVQPPVMQPPAAPPVQQPVQQAPATPPPAAPPQQQAAAPPAQQQVPPAAPAAPPQPVATPPVQPPVQQAPATPPPTTPVQQPQVAPPPPAAPPQPAAPSAAPPAPQQVPQQPPQ